MGLKIIECTGYTKEEAFANLKFNPDSPVVPGSNATQAWGKVGKPNVNTLAFKRFIVEQLEEKTKNEPGYGIYIVIDPPIRDIRKRPYTVVNCKATATREWKFVYHIREDKLDINYLKEPIYDEYGELTDESEESMEISILEPGLIVATCESKAEALVKMKELITETHKCYSILPAKVPDITPVAAFGFYTPSSKAKKGTYIACGFEKEEKE